MKRGEKNKNKPHFLEIYKLDLLHGEVVWFIVTKGKITKKPADKSKTRQKPHTQKKKKKKKKTNKPR